LRAAVQSLVQGARVGGVLQHAALAGSARAYDRPVRNDIHKLALALPLLALIGGGCSSSAKNAPDPASAVPASAPLYVSAMVRPEGSLKSNALADAQSLTHEANAYGALLAVLDLPNASTAKHVSAAEVDPWLGERAGIFLTRIGLPAVSGVGRLLGLLRPEVAAQLFARSGSSAVAEGAAAGVAAQGAVILDVTDVAKARAFLRARASGTRVASYRGVAYRVNAAGEAYGLIGQFVVVGSESGLQEVVATTQGAPALSGVATYVSLRGSAAEGQALANAYAETTALAHSLLLAPGGSPQLLSLLRALAPSGPLYLSLAPRNHELRLDIDEPSGSASRTPSATESEQAASTQQLVQGLPEGSSLAIGVQNFGALAERALALLPGLAGTRAATPATSSRARRGKGLLSALAGAGTPAASALPGLERVLSALALKSSTVKGEYLSWMGPAGAFVNGSSLLEFNAAIVITPRGNAVPSTALSNLPALLAGSGATVNPITVPGAEAAVAVGVSGLPVPLQVGEGQGKFVIGLGVSPVQEALSPSGTLGSSAAYQAAVKALGEGIQPELMVNVPTLLTVAGAVGLSGDGVLSQISPYLHSLTTLTVGSKQLGSITRTRVLIGLD
jgi:hypothetical protein